MTVDMVFSIMGAMLMSKKVKDWNPNIYPHLVKTMDSHHIAIDIACEAQQYVDRDVKMDSTTSHDTANYARRLQQSSRINFSVSEMVILFNTIFFRHTNELRNSALTTQQRKFFICSFEYLVCFWCCKTRGV